MFLNVLLLISSDTITAIMLDISMQTCYNTIRSREHLSTWGIGSQCQQIATLLFSFSLDIFAEIGYTIHEAKIVADLGGWIPMCENNAIAFFKQPCTNLIGITVLAGDSFGLCGAVFLVLYMLLRKHYTLVTATSTFSRMTALSI